MQITNFLAIAAAMASSAAAHSRLMAPRNYATTGPSRCANQVPPAKIYDQMSRLASDDMTYGRVHAAEQGVSKCKRAIKVPTWIHAAVPSNATDAFLNDASLQKQLDVLNAAYRDHDVIFVKEGFTRTKSDSVSKFSYTDDAEGAIGGSPNKDMEAYWKQYRTGNYQTLHIWLYNEMTNGLLGIATFPDADKPEANKWLDGVHANGNSVPGGSLPKYGLGATVIHEVGHWLGLFHVFSDEGVCGGQGDMVDDTPEQSTPTYDCPADNTKDSCPAPGFDSIHNFMDYSDDICLTEFTEGQEARIHNVWKNIRSTVPW